MTVPVNNPDYPKVVWARVRETGTRYLRLVVSEKTLAALFETKRFAAMGEYTGLIVGSGVLVRPTVIYQGLKRPFRRPGVDESVYAYVSRPSTSFSYRAAPRVVPGNLQTIPAPLGSVFVAFVSINPHVVDPQMVDTPDDPAVAGTVLFWEWTMASEGMPDLPRDADSRYGRKIWPTP